MALKISIVLLSELMPIRVKRRGIVPCFSVTVIVIVTVIMIPAMFIF